MKVRKGLQIGIMVFLAGMCLTGCGNVQNPVEKEFAAFTTYMSRIGYQEEDIELLYEEEYSYDEHGNVVSEKHQYDDYSSFYPFSYEYDENGNMIKKTTYDSDGEIYQIYEYDYDDANKMIHSVNTFFSTDAVHSFEDFYGYDDEGHEIWEGDPGCPTHTFEYDSNGNLIKKCEYGVDIFEYFEYQYNEKGLLLSEIIKELEKESGIPLYSHETSYLYDDEGRILKTEEISVYYDAEGNVTETIESLYSDSYYDNIKREDAYYMGKWYMTQLWRYDEAGNEIMHMVFEDSEEGVRMSAWEVTAYDEQDRITQKKYMWDHCISLYGGGSGTGIYVSELQYDENGNVIRRSEKSQNINEDGFWLSR